MLRESLETLILVGAIYAFVNLSSARFVVEGDSMQPNFATGQFLIVSRVHYLLGEPARGDIIVFHYPDAPEMDLIKRVIGLPGDVVSIDEGHVFVNETALEEPYIREPCDRFECPDAEWTVGSNQYFVMGDNRNESRDSRSFGVVDETYIVGQALLRYWPPEDFAAVSHYAYPDESQ
jgi:signal peptidase I